MNKYLNKMFRNDKEALRLINKLNKNLNNILELLYIVEEKTDYKIKELDKAINELQEI